MTTVVLQIFFITLLSICSFNPIKAQSPDIDGHQSQHDETKETLTQKENTIPDYLYKIISKDIWKESLAHNKLFLSPIDEKFIHLAKEEQISHVTKKFWNGVEHLILKIETKKIIGNLKYETNPGGSTKYFHQIALIFL